MNLPVKKIAKKIYEKKFFIILCCIFSGGCIALFFPRTYKGFARKAELGEVNKMEIHLDYRSRDKHSHIITEEYCSRYLVNNKNSIDDIQKLLNSISMKPKYNYGEINTEGLVWSIQMIGEGDYDLHLWTYSNKLGKYYISAIIKDQVGQFNMVDQNKDFFPGCYEINEEENEEIIQMLFNILKDNIIYMTAEKALQLSEENAEWSEFMYYYAIDQHVYGENAVRIPIQDTDMEIEIYYGMIIQNSVYIEPIERAVLYDGQGNEYEYFSEEGRDILRKEVVKN